MGVVFPPEPEPDENREVQRRREGGGDLVDELWRAYTHARLAPTVN